MSLIFCIAEDFLSLVSSQKNEKQTRPSLKQSRFL